MASRRARPLATSKREAKREAPAAPRSLQRSPPSERPGPAGGKRDLNRRQRLDALLEGGLDRFLAGGLDAVTIDELARAGGVAKGNFYRYFESKAGIVQALFAPVLEALQAAFDACAEALRSARSPEQLVVAYAGLGESLSSIVLRSPKRVRLYLQESRGPRTETRAPITDAATLITQRAVELTLIAQAHGLLRAINPQVSALAVIGAIERQLQAFFAGELTQPAEAVIEALISLVLDGLKGPAATAAADADPNTEQPLGR